MRVLALCSYPLEAAATRFRLAQFVEPLRKRGIELEISPFLDPAQFKDLYSGVGIVYKASGLIRPFLRRLKEVIVSRRYDVVLIQREAMPFGPGLIEWLICNIARTPLLLDLDDATYVRYISPTYGRAGSYLKFFGKTDRLIGRASVVICGNRFIAEHAEALGAETVVVPTVVDTDVFKPVEKDNDPPVIGWIGTHSTYPFLESIFPALERLAETYEFKVRIVGAGRLDVRLKGVEVENIKWDLERETRDFASLDIGLYPISTSESANSDWIKGKSGFKAIQFLSVGVPFVMSPVGVCAEIGAPGKTHFNAETETDWYNSLGSLLADEALHHEMARSARTFALENYGLDEQTELLARTLLRTAN